jgi:hypothetical protein
LAYWRDALSELPEEITLPADRSWPAITSPRGNAIAFRISDELHHGLAALARETGATLLTVLQAGFAALLTRLGAGADIPIGGRSPAAAIARSTI